MKLSPFLTFIFLVVTFSQESIASNCRVFESDSGGTVKIDSSTECITFTNVMHTKTVFVIDSTRRIPQDFNLTIQTPDNRTLYDALITGNSYATTATLNTFGNTEVSFHIDPKNKDRDYKFSIIHHRDDDNEFTFINISFIATERKSNSAPPPFPAPIPIGACYDEFGQEIFCVPNFDNSGSANAAIQSEHAACNESNRPFNKPPSRRTSGRDMNVNELLRNAEDHTEWVTRNLPAESVLAAIYSHLVQQARIGGILDVAHDDDRTTYVGGFEDGNFLYGAYGTALGISEFTLARGSSFYSSFTQSDNRSDIYRFFRGIFRAATNTGDPQEDILQEQRGINYAREVWAKDKNNPNSFSCLDEKSVNEARDPTNGETGIGVGGGIDTGVEPPNDPSNNLLPQAQRRRTAFCYRELPDGEGSTYIQHVDCPS